MFSANVLFAMIGVAILIGLMALVLYLDLARLLA